MVFDETSLYTKSLKTQLNLSTLKKFPMEYQITKFPTFNKIKSLLKGNYNETIIQFL